MNISPQSTASVYSRRSRNDSKRDAASDVHSVKDLRVQEESALTFCQFVAESKGKIKELYVRPGPNGEKLSRHATLWARLSRKSDGQAQAARTCLQANFKPLLNHPDLAVREGTQQMLEALTGKLDDSALRTASQALGQAIANHRFDRVNGVVKQAPQAQNLGAKDEVIDKVDGEFSDETSSSEESQEWSEHELPTASVPLIPAQAAPLPRAGAPVGASLFTARDAAVLANRLRQMDGNAVPYIGSDSESGRACFVQTVHEFATRKQNIADDDVQQTAVKLLMHVEARVHDYKNLKAGDAPLLEALDAFVAYEVKRTRLDIGRLDAEGTAELPMNAAEALHRYVQDLPDGSVLMASVGPNDELFVHARLAGQPGAAEFTQPLENSFCGLLGQLATGFAGDKRLGVEVEADEIADFAADHRDKEMPIVVTTELRQHLKQMSAWASTQANEDRLRREALAPIVIGAVVNGTSELNDGALSALRDYIDRVPEGSVLSLYQNAAGQLMLMAQPVSPGETTLPRPHANDVENLRFTLEHVIEPFTAHDASDVATHAKNVLAMVQCSRESDQALVANHQLKNAVGYVHTYGPLVA